MRSLKMHLVVVSIFVTCILAFVEAQAGRPDLILRDVKVIQVVEDPRLIVAQKPAALKVSLLSTFQETVRVPIKVTYNFGQSSYVDKGPDDRGVALLPGENTIYIPGGPVESHGPWGAYLTQPWLEGEPYLYWDNKGLDDKIEVVIDPDHAIDEANYDNNTMTFEKEVMKSMDFRVLFVPVVLSGDTSINLSSDVLELHRSFMLNTYPLASLSFTQGSEVHFHEIVSDQATAYNDFVFDLSSEARLLGYDRVAVVIRGINSCGLAIQMLSVPEDRVPVILEYSCLLDNSYASLTAHEIGHTFYLWHPHGDWFDDLRVYSDIRYSVTERLFGTMENTFMSYLPLPHWNDKDRYQDYPRTWFQTPPQYQNRFTIPGQFQWNLLDQFKAKLRTSVLLLKAKLYKSGMLELLSWYRMNGSADLSPGGILPAPGATSAVNAFQAVSNDDSRHLQIVMFNSSQQVLAVFPFQVSFRKIIEPDFGGEKIIVETDIVPFQFTVPEIEGMAHIQIQDEVGNVLGERAVTSNAPEVKVLTPDAGEDIPAGSEYDICWSGLDQDGDTLKYFLSFSSDSGENWIPLILETEGTCHSWNTSGLAQGTKYLVKVIATDGINSGEDISDSPFSIGEPDSDQDGVRDPVDKCPQSILEGTINIDGCNSGVNNRLIINGCTMNDLIAQCAYGAQNHGEFVSCVDGLTSSWKKMRLITGKKKDAIQSCAAEADIP